jgi:hypothetical protein
VTDREAIKPYSANVESTFKPFGGRFIVCGADPVPLEGRSPKGRLVIIAFDCSATIWMEERVNQDGVCDHACNYIDAPDCRWQGVLCVAR